MDKWLDLANPLSALGDINTIIFKSINMSRFFFFFLLVINVSNKLNATNKSDSLKKILAVELKKNTLTSSLSSIDVIDIYMDTVFIINKDKLIVLDIKSGKISSDSKINLFLSAQAKLNKYPRQLVVRNNNFYFSFFNELFTVNRDGKIKKNYSGYFFINRFIPLKNSFLVAARDTIKLINLEGKTTFFLPFNFTDDQYLNNENMIFYSSVPEDSIYCFSVNSRSEIELKRISPLNVIKELKDPTLAFEESNFLIVYDYWKRNNVYLIGSEADNGKIEAKISLKNLNYIPTINEIKAEEGLPNFKILSSNSSFYILTLSKGKLNIGYFKI